MSAFVVLVQGCGTKKKNKRGNSARSSDVVTHTDPVDYDTCTVSSDPGFVNMRRLTRFEYNNTVRDLLGVTSRPADDFPADDIGYGFDNIAALQSVAPVLMERYIAAAEQLAEEVLAAAPGSSSPQSQKFEAENITQSTGGNVGNGFWNIWGNGEVYTSVTISRGGTYRLRARAYQSAAGTEAAKMVFAVDNRDVSVVNVQALQNAPQIYETTTTLEPGSIKFAVGYINDEIIDGADRNLMVDWIEVIGPEGATSGTARNIINCDPAAIGDDACAREVFTPLVRRAYRRAITAEDVDGYVRIVRLAREQGDTFQVGVKNALQALLISSQFLFRVEDASGGKRELTDFELASRLSYFIWASMPDDALLLRAERGELHQVDGLRAETMRMLKDPRAQALTEGFAAQWLHLRDLNNMERDKNIFPNFSPELVSAMQEESKRLFSGIKDENRGLKELLLSEETFVNQPLAQLYGLPNVSGWQKVSVPATRRGLLTQGSYLAATGNPTRSSPVKRGKWVMEQMLCLPPPPPPPNVEGLDGRIDANLPIKERMQQHRGNPACAGCHVMMDQIGFGFEHFDAIGAYRDRDGVHAVDPTGQLPSGEHFADHRELIDLLAAKPDLPHCFTEKMLTYATGRGMVRGDMCAVRAISEINKNTEYHFEDMVWQVVNSHFFRTRRPEGGP